MAKSLKIGLQSRTANIERAAIDNEKRTASLSFSSELPVERWFGVEILDHSPESVDLSRLNSRAALLVDHNTGDQVGVVEMAEVSPDRKGRATVRFGKSQRAEEIFQDVKDGIRSLVSVGYRINKMVTDKVDKGVETLRAMSWTPMEISLVSVPADPTVGIGRAEDKDFETIIEVPEVEQERKSKNMPEEPKNPTATLEISRNDILKDERQRTEEIRAIADRLDGKVPEVRQMALRAEKEGLSVEQFRTQVLEAMPKVQPIRAAQPLEIPVREWSKYSLSRAILQKADGKLDGFEAEVSQEVALKRGMQAGGFWVPPEAFAANMGRSFVAGTGTLGGNIIETSNLGDQFIELLRNRTQVMRLGATVLNLDNPVTIPQQNAAGSVNWVGETVASTLSVGNFTQITLSPKGVSAFQQYGKQLLATNNPSIDRIVRNDILQILGIAIDLAALHGTGANSQPTGIANVTGIGTVTLAANGQALGNSTAYPALVSLETAIATANADVANMAYLARASHRGTLRTQPRFANTNTPVWESAPGNVDGMVNGYRAAVTNQIATNLTTGTATTITSAIFFANWSELLIANFNGGAIDLVVDPYTLAVNSVIRIIARQWVDINVRHAASFACLGGII
jgi:HK97 family phage major capsid protein/HK97 family phage prohead protease